MKEDGQLPAWQRFFARKLYLDELYETIIEKPVLWLSEMLHRFMEVKGIDRLVNGTGNMAVRTGNLLRYIQTGNVGFYMFLMIIGVMLILIFNVLI